MPIDWKPLLPIVKDAQSFVLTSHTRPDCDALGSELGLAYALEGLGKRVRIVNGDGVPPHIAFIDPQERVGVIGRDVTREEAHACDVHVVLDTSAWGQLGDMADVLRDSPATKVVIDHHVSGDDLGATVFKDTAAEAAGRLVLEAIDALGAPLSAEAATALFYAISTDTGWFRFPSVGEQTFRAAARLVAAGASPCGAFSALYDNNSLARVRLHGRVMDSVRTELDGRLSFGEATAQDLAETGAAVSDTEDVVNRLLSINGVEVAALLADLEEGKVKISLRSRTDLDVRAVAERFGGGGHNKAAGARFRGTIPEARAAVLEVMGELLG